MDRSKVFPIVITILLVFFICRAEPKVLFKDDFESDTVGKPPANWNDLGPPTGYAGGGLSVVDNDPMDENNKVFNLIPKGQDTNSHNVWAVHDGDKSWTTYVWEFDWLFPEDNYCPVAFRVMDKDQFCQVSRRPGGSEFHIYQHTAAAWNDIKRFTFKNEALKWYRVQISVKDNDFTFKIKDRNDKTQFAKIKEPEILSNAQAGQLYPSGGIAAQEGYFGMLDNVIVGETENDILSVESRGKLAICWGMLK